MRLAVYGDSIAAGLGARDAGFPTVMAEHLGGQLDDYSASAMTVNYSANVAADAPMADVAIVMHGITEAIPRPTSALLRLAPPRWRGPGRMDPRPYFSTDRRKRLGQRAESWLRWRYKTVLLRLGTEQWLPAEDYRAGLDRLLHVLEGCPEVLVVGPTPIAERYFPGAPAELARYGDISRAVAAEHGRTYVPLDDVLRPSDFLADGFHPSAAGHRKIANRVLHALPASVRPA